MTLTSEDSFTLSAIPEYARADVELWRTRLAPVWRVHKEGGSVVAEMQRAARDAAVPYTTLRAKWYVYKKKGIGGLINRTRHPLDRAFGLPALFVQHWKKLLEAHQRDRTGKESWRKLRRQLDAWRAGDETCALPGYDAPPANELGFPFPKGWSLPNLRRHGLTRYGKALRHQGTMAAKNFLPSVRTTRAGMDHLEMIMVDDQWHDVHVNFVNERGEVINRRLMRPLSFNAIDVSSGCDFARGHKPIIWDDFTKQRKMLTEADFFWFIIHVLSEHGWRADGGTTIVHEHGTANLSQALRDRIISATQGGVTFSAGGILGAPLRKGMLFEGAPRGNFKFKAHRESWFNIFRNYSSALPAPTGLNPKMAPEENYGLTKYNNMILRVMEKLPKERAALLMLPALNWHQYLRLSNEISELVNRRIDHNLEGWEEMGRIAQEVRLDVQSESWLTVHDIARLQNPEAQRLALALMDQKFHGRSRKLSPREVYDSGGQSTRVLKLNPHLWNVIMPAEYGHLVRVNEKHEIVIRDREVSSQPLVYLSHIRTSRGRKEVIPAGEQVRVYCNPWKPEVALICEPDDSAIGLATLMPRPSRMDTDGMLRTYGSVKSLEADLQRESAARAASVMEERGLMRSHNRRVIDGKPVTASQIEADEIADDILASLEAPVTPGCADAEDSSYDPLS